MHVNDLIKQAAVMAPFLPESNASGPPNATNCASSLKNRYADVMQQAAAA
jgi:hypothetical protein